MISTSKNLNLDLFFEEIETAMPELYFVDDEGLRHCTFTVQKKNGISITDLTPAQEIDMQALIDAHDATKKSKKQKDKDKKNQDIIDLAAKAQTAFPQFTKKELAVLFPELAKELNK